MMTSFESGESVPPAPPDCSIVIFGTWLAWNAPPLMRMPESRKASPASATSISSTFSTLIVPPGAPFPEDGIDLHPNDKIDLGNGAGATVHVPPPSGGSGTIEIPARPAGGGGGGIGTVDVDGLDVAPPVWTIPPNFAPEITSGTELKVAENTTAVTTVTAADPDAGQTLTFSIAGGADAARFQIDAGTGALSFVAPPVFEQPGDAGGDNVYDGSSRCPTTATPLLSNQQAVAVRVTDAAETTTMMVQFVSEAAVYKNTFGWYNKVTGEGGILFPTVEANGGARPCDPGYRRRRSWSRPRRLPMSPTSSCPTAAACSSTRPTS
jgi:hypothetical protein